MAVTWRSTGGAVPWERKKGEPQSPWAQSRAKEMLRLYTVELLTLKEIGDRYGITRERVRQIIHDVGANSSEAVKARARQRLADLVASVDRTRLRELKEAGMRNEDVARELGVPYRVVAVAWNKEEPDGVMRRIWQRKGSSAHEYTDDDIIHAIKFACEKNGGGLLRSQDYNTIAMENEWMPSLALIYNRGGFSTFAERAVVPHNPKRPKLRSDRRDAEQCLADLLVATRANGGVVPSVTRYDEISRGTGLTSCATIRKRLGGTWKTAMVAALDALDAEKEES